ncbi:MAG: NADH-quinone oxidoreductase subunit NuoE [Lentimicrobiaceae bacterium]|nr:NADH-quinone oxidoreductase subunit NuoE [Lentimicrobiaceae bacterium]
MSDTIKSIIISYPPDAQEQLLSILQSLQDVEGYLTEEAISEVCSYLKIPKTKVYGIASFYDQFRFKPKAKVIIKVCHGTSCHIEGAVKLVDEIKNVIGIGIGETTKDNKFSLVTVGCMGACSKSPVISFNDEFYILSNPKEIRLIIEKYQNEY